MFKDVEPLLKECEETLAELKKIGNMEVACYVQGFINSINKLPEVERGNGMSDNIDKNEIRKAIDRLQLEHPVHFAFDATRIVEPSLAKAVQDDIDRVAKSLAKDASIHIICEMAKLYLDGVKPTVEPNRSRGEWIKITKVTPNFFAYKCSICGNFDYLHNRRSENGCKYVLGRYCWACGSLMKEEGEAE